MTATSNQPGGEVQRPTLNRTLGLAEVTAGGVGMIVGAGIRVLIGAAALVFFAFLGFDEVNTVAEETRDPTRTVPRALLLGLFAVAAMLANLETRALRLGAVLTVLFIVAGLGRARGAAARDR
ncbi:MAG TPA: hypothetical protein VKV26_02590 [Dehalococcoidia bacterium]|nr:hypothetical protein [Dehalococcoidia bacterium]